jgi:putative membrane fusion protein
MNKSKEKKGKKIKKFKMIVVVFLLIYVPLLLNWIFGLNIQVALIKNGIIEKSVNTECYISRDEEVILSPFNGQYIPYIREGERAAADSMIAYVIKDSSLNLLKELQEKDSNIIKEQNRKTINMEIFSEDLKKIDIDISRKIDMVIEDVSSNVFLNINRYKNEINRLIEKKAEVIGGIIIPDSYMKELQEEKQRILENINKNTYEAVSGFPGTISYKIDGLEDMLKPEIIKEITPEFINNMESNIFKKDNNENKAIVEQPFIKIIKGFDFYLIGILNISDKIVLENNERIRVRINDIGRLSYGEIYHMSEIYEDQYIVAIKTDRYLSETCSLRKVNVDIVKSLYEGLKVPFKSLLNVDIKENKASLMIVKANYSVKEDVIIEGYNEKYAIIKGINDNVILYDSFVINPENVKEGQQIK